MRSGMLRRCGVMLAAMVLTGVVATRDARASGVKSTLEECTTTCALGGCSASTWNPFKDCVCGCLPNGGANCTCGYWEE